MVKFFGRVLRRFLCCLSVVGVVLCGCAANDSLADEPQFELPKVGKIERPARPRLLDLPAEPTKAAASRLLLGITRAGDRLIAVGERGIIILSDDGGRNWQQAAAVPVSDTLTAVRFGSPEDGWAVGHMGVILHTADGGGHWTRQLDGEQAAALIREVAQRGVDSAGDHPSDQLENQLQTAEDLVADGPDKPFLSLIADNATRATVVGAFGLAFATSDAGATWLPVLDRLDDPQGLHIYSILRDGDRIYAAGEQGLFRRSQGGTRFDAVHTPYSGSFFGILEAADGVLILYGLRGTILRSSDEGESWTKVASGIDSSFTSAIVLADSQIVIASQGGQLLESDDAGKSFNPLHLPPLPPIAGLAQAPDGALVIIGIRGAMRMKLPVAARQ